MSEWWWSSTEEDATDAYIIEFKTNGQAKILDRQKIGDNGVIRPVFAFLQITKLTFKLLIGSCERKYPYRNCFFYVFCQSVVE